MPVIVPDEIDGSKLTALIDERYNFTVAGGMNQYAGKMLRIGIIGEITNKEIDFTYRVHSGSSSRVQKVNER